jgi:hypothetical protein
VKQKVLIIKCPSENTVYPIDVSYDLNVYVSPKFTCTNPKPQNGGIRNWSFWGDHEGVVNSERSLKTALPLPLCEGTQGKMIPSMYE